MSFLHRTGRIYVSVRRAKWLILSSVLTPLIIAALALSYSPKRGVETKLDAIRAQGLPASPSELDAWYKAVPDEKNQALLILEAAKARVDARSAAGSNSVQFTSFENGQTLSPDTDAMVAEFLAANQSALDFLDKAVRLSDSRYPMNLGLGAYTLLPHLSQVKGLTQLLRTRVVHQSRLGKIDDAVSSLNTAFILASSLENEPLLISDLVRIACISITLNALDQVLSEHQLNADQLTLLSTKLAQAEAAGPQALFRALVGERAASISVFKLSLTEMDRLGAPTTPPPNAFGKEAVRALGSQAYQASGLRERDLSLYLENMEGFIRASKLEFPDILREFEHALSEQSARFSHGFGRFAIYSQMLLPALNKAALKEAALTARLRCTRVALAIERFRLDHNGSLPETLDPLVPQYLSRLPPSPFDNSPLTFERTSEKGYRVSTSPPSSQSSGTATPAPPNLGISVTR